MNNDYPILDGVAPSWADIIIRATPDGAPLIDIKDIAAINTNSVVEVGEQRGASGGRVVRRTTGQVSYEASMTLYRSGYQKLVRGLKAAAESAGLLRGNQVLISLVHFGIQVQHTPFNDVEIYEYRIKGCRLLGRDLNGAEGTDADQVEVALSPLEIVDMIDGKEIAWL
jgi:hypothetical protein